MNNLPMLMPTDGEWAQMKTIAETAVKSGLLPLSIKTADQALIIALKGRELGLPPMVAFSHIHVIQGKPCCSSELMLAHIRKEFPKAEINFEEATEKKCVLKARRKPEEQFSTFEMTFDQAYEAGFAKQWNKEKGQWETKDNWKKQPKTMLRWRMISEMKRFLFPEVLMGIDYTPEELEDLRDVTPAQQAQPTPAAAAAPVKEIKNYAPKSRQEAESWQPGKDKPSDPVEAPQEGHSRDELAKSIRSLALELGFDGPKIQEICQAEFKKATALLTTDEMDQLVSYLEGIKSTQPPKKEASNV